MEFNVFGDTVISDGTYITIENLIKLLKRPTISPRYRISVLNMDESVNYIIPENDIVENGISYTEDYQNGQRRNVSLTLINENGKYTPSIDGIWLSTKFSLDVGLQYKNDVLWFPKGIYIMGDVSLSHNDVNSTVEIQLKDKFAMFEGKLGTLETPYTIEIGSDIFDAMNGILNFDRGDGYIFDYKELLFDPSLIGKKTQTTIRVEEGGNLAQVIDELIQQLSAEYYYNNVGNFCVYPLNVTVNDSEKPIIWTFSAFNRELHNMNLNYHNEDVVNVVKVVGENIDSGVYSAVVTNENPASPICIQQIGRRAAPVYKETSIWSDDLAYDLANYYLRQASFVSVDFNVSIAFNPLLVVNNLIEVENDLLNFKREKILITSISFTSNQSTMQLKMCNVQDLPFVKERRK